MAESAASPVLIVTDVPATVMADMVRNQKLGGELLGMFKNSILPVNRDELVPPSVSAPPFCSSAVAEGLLLKRFSQMDISGCENCLLLNRLCQKGVASVAARLWNARPMRPEAEPERRPLVVWSTERNVCWFTVKVARLTVSAATVPATSPTPY